MTRHQCHIKLILVQISFPVRFSILISTYLRQIVLVINQLNEKLSPNKIKITAENFILAPTVCATFLHGAMLLIAVSTMLHILLNLFPETIDMGMQLRHQPFIRPQQNQNVIVIYSLH